MNGGAFSEKRPPACGEYGRRGWRGFFMNLKKKPGAEEKSLF